MYVRGDWLVQWFYAFDMIQFGVDSCRSAIRVNKILNRKRTKVEALRDTTCY